MADTKVFLPRVYLKRAHLHYPLMLLFLQGDVTLARH